MADHNEIKFAHFRAMDPFTGEVTDPRGGVTIAYRPHPEGGFEVGVAQCSEKDNYSKTTGRNYAEDRLAHKDAKWYRRINDINSRADLLADATMFYGYHLGYFPKSKRTRAKPAFNPLFTDLNDVIPF